MSSEEWNEVKRLAADFQKAQLSTSEQKLSEGNIIEIINKLVETKLLDVIFTLDGKEYITPQHLTREIKDELYVHGGRINLVDLASILNVDLSQITERASEIKKSDPSYSIILGQLIDKSYLKKIAVEIDEKLSEQGHLTIGDLTQLYDLPSQFLQSVIEKNIGKTIRGKQDRTDPTHFFTDAFVSRNQACIRGALAAITRPMNISTLLSLCDLQEGVFFSVIEGMIQNKEVPGVISGKQGSNAIYVPAIYSKSQSDWVNSFYRQNGYLEYEALTRLGISDPHTFLRKHYPNEKLMLLSSCAVGAQLFEIVEAAVDEAVATGTFIDVMPILPSVFETEDADEILQEILKNRKNKLSNQIHIYCGTIAVTDQFVQRITKSFDDVIKEKAEKVVSLGIYQKFNAESKLSQNRNNADDEVGAKSSDKREERRKKATGGKGGGGTQGRETKMKSTKKKHQRGKNAGGGDSDSDTPQSSVKESKGTAAKLELLTLADVREVIEGDDLLMEDDLVEFVAELAAQLHPSLNKVALTAAQAEFESTIASSAQLRRKVHGDLQEKLNSMVVNVRQFEKGLKNFPQKETQLQLAKYLMKSLCTEITNEIFAFVAQENMIQYDNSKELTIEARVKIANDLPSAAKETLMNMHKSLAADNIDGFLNTCEPAMGMGVCDMVLRKYDKKKERPLLFGHRAGLLEQLQATDDPSAVLLLAALVIFETITLTMLHASGRFVSLILEFIRTGLSNEDYMELQHFYDLVMKTLSSDADKETLNETLQSLSEHMPRVKAIAANYKKLAAADKQQAD